MGTIRALVASFATLVVSAGCAIDSESRPVGAGSGSEPGGSGGAAGEGSGGLAAQAGRGGAAGSEAAGAAGVPSGAAGASIGGASGSAGAGGEAGQGEAGVGGGGAAGVAGQGGQIAGGGAGGGGGDSCANGVADAGETDIDCGKVCVLRCALTQNCAVGADCASSFCDGQRCVASQCLDHKQNGNETDLDCGGSCPACTLDQACFVDTDCATGLACTNGVCRTTGRTCRDILRRNPKAKDDVYFLDPDGAGPSAPFLAACDMATDGGGWTSILRAAGPYTPAAAGVGDLTKDNDAFAKLADAQINALAPGNRTFRVRGDVGVKSLYFMSSARFADPAPGWGMTASPVGLVCESTSLAQCAFRQLTWGQGGYSWIDTLSSKHSGDDCERYFIDVYGTVGCYLKAAGQRCVAAGASCPAKGPFANRAFGLWVREWAPEEGVLAGYAFEEGKGDTTKDTTGRGLDGTLVGDGDSRPTWTTNGHRGSALELDGSKHTHVRVQFPDTASGKVPASEAVFLPTSNTTFSLWIRAGAPPTTAFRFQSVTDEVGSLDRTLDLLPGEVQLQSYLYTPRVRTIAGKNPSDGQWHHVVWSLDGQNGSSLFLDGKRIDQAKDAAGCGLGCSDFSWATRYLIGSAPASGKVDGLTGAIDDVRLYQIPLVPEDVATLYEAQK